ncbi:MAG: rRNA pseudouridine synthase [Firmicutes bacterium]|nr:rRNA pseudouridine synthase [Bacillota bacterium]
MPIRRLDQALALRGFGSRKEIHALVRAGQVQINGIPAHSAAQKIDLERDRVTLRGEPVCLQEFIYIMLHKPPGVVSAARDSNTPTVIDLLPAQLRRRGLFPVGRLDKDTTGLLLLTDDGALAHALLSPKKHVPKTYLAALQTPATENDIRAFAAGMALPPAEGHPPEDCLPAELSILEGYMARVVLREGKYHQIKRMFAARGNGVLSLHRESMGSLRLDEALQPGECRELTAEEIAELKTIE